MNTTSKTTLQALGYGLAGAAAAAIANETARRVAPRRSPLGFLRRRRFNNLFAKGPLSKGTIVGNMLSNPLFFNIVGERNVKRNLLRSALLGVGAGLGSLALPRQKRSIWGARASRQGSGLLSFGRLLAGGLVAAAASRLLKRTLLDRRHHEEHTHEHNAHERHVHEQRPHEQHIHEQFG
jgi:hypothetical protein